MNSWFCWLLEGEKVWCFSLHGSVKYGLLTRVTDFEQLGVKLKK
jgi:hypothetical protein